ncbi:EAL domain-containing protein [Schlesneria paludicola]|uniref:EAL domain-containing protein n=1 Tax=Schlesneria paludicola TaxID=360056 RepID=UPI00029A6455|nr:EAL domain-containing protein [Schlesneria paludicola]
MFSMMPFDTSNEVSSSWFITGACADGQSQRISVPSGRFQVGRRSDLNLSLLHPSVSKLHAEFIASEVALFVRDLGSTNGTFVNGERISADTPIGEHDLVQFAGFEFMVGRMQLENPLQTMVSCPPEWQSAIRQFHRLLSDRAVVPYFQPIVQFSDCRTIGYEVLARSFVTGLSSPKDMFAAAERVSQAARLSVLCRENGIESAKSLPNPGILFLNTHPSEKPHAGLIESLTQLRVTAPDVQIVLELHEAAISEPLEIADFRDELRALRIQLAYDDFGAGQARLKELSEVAPDYLKFDIGLIRDIHLAPQRQQVVAGLVRLVRDLGIYALAEGIETEEEACVCREIGFTHAQGYLYGKPAAAESLVS